MPDLKSIQEGAAKGERVFFSLINVSKGFLAFYTACLEEVTNGGKLNILKVL